MDSSPNGFYTVYGTVFDRLVQNERDFSQKRGGREPEDWPSFGNEETDLDQVGKFYTSWLNFVTVMDFAFADLYHPSSGSNRRIRRAMEDENQKARKAMKKAYTETVRQLTAFVKRRDMRVLRMEKEEAERKAAAKQKEEALRKEREAERRRKAAEYKDADWIVEETTEDVEEMSEESEKEALWCVICDKVFKSERALENHER